MLGGHSMGAHTAVAYALAPSRAAFRPGRDRAGVRGRDPEQRLEYWDGLADALSDGGVEGFVAYVVERQETEPGLARDGGADHPRTDARFTAIRRRSSPRSATSPARGPSSASTSSNHSRCRCSSSPATTAPIPGHPRAVAEAYAEHLPRARLIGEEEAESPLAWQGGKLSREIAEFII